MQEYGYLKLTKRQGEARREGNQRDERKTRIKPEVKGLTVKQEEGALPRFDFYPLTSCFLDTYLRFFAELFFSIPVTFSATLGSS